MFKKVIAMLLTSVMVLSGTVMGFAEPNLPKLGGGPSESAVWEFYKEDYEILTKAELEELSDELYYANKSSSGSRKRYEAAKFIAGLVAVKTFPPASFFLLFVSDYFDIIDNSEYQVNRALNRFGNSKTYTVNVDIYQREATRERLVSVTSVEGR